MTARARGRSAPSSSRGASGRIGAALIAHLPFWLLAAFLTLVFATGGSSFGNVPQLVVLRPVAVLLAGYGLATLRRDHWQAYRTVFMMAIAIVALTAIHLVPLPPMLWHLLPGRDLAQAIDAAAGLQDAWRPLSLTPSRTINALFALAIPVATLVLAAQLGSRDRIRILYVLLALSAVSALIGLLQAAGLPISLFHTLSTADTIEAAGLFANQNHQAALLACAIPMLAVAARTVEKGRRAAQRIVKPLATAAGLVLVIQLIVTGSRAGLVLGTIAIAFTLFYGLAQSDRLDRMPPRMRLGIRAALVVGIAGAAALVTTLAARGLALQRLETVTADLRPRLWASILPILPDYQPLGSGIGSYVEVYRAHEPLALLRATYSNHAHNDYLEVLLTAGLPGLLLLVAAVVLVGRVLWRHRQGQAIDTVLARLGGTIIVIIACASVTDYPLRTPLLASVFVLAALWCAKPEGAERRSGG
ncbi:O-antigen ligase family protein [uncultured Sphingomonas sp.]|uniref:O-antigen ligase family protein n=1 Tax=uncultured Sphingomonas sp. TaxID=158754 RepID=UPI0025D4F985|nr:O-antigen ligase family protein [uncultured Sphingomonas sp.]